MNKEDFFEWFNGMITEPEELKRQIIEAYMDGRIDKETYLKRMYEADRRTN